MRFICCLLTVTLLHTGTSSTFGQRPDAYQNARAELVANHVAGHGIEDPRVLRSIRETPRHRFVDRKQRKLAYYDMALPIGHGQTISPPYIVAFMTDRLTPQPTDKVLEIGTGSGYQAAVLSPLVKDVYTIEIVRPLGEKAAETLEDLGYENVHTRIGDGYLGWPEAAPFDKIIVTCSPEKIPQPLIDQLVDGGQIVVPVGERFQQMLCRFTKTDGKLEREPLESTFFVPMTGEAETKREVIPDPSRMEIADGGFEETLSEDSNAPRAWYYVREGQTQEDGNAPEGSRVMVFRNFVPGRNAHALQAFGVSREFADRLEVSMSIQLKNVRDGRQPRHKAHALVEFYGKNRAPVGHQIVGPWSGTEGWHTVRDRVRVPKSAELAVIGVGLFGATGELRVDDVRVESSK